MDKDTFINCVLKRMPEAFFQAENCSLEELLMLKSDLARKHAQGWALNDAVAYMRCTEYANTNLDEDIALKRVDAIVSKYK